jgi:flagellar biosynthesis/type III secretory pathway chaperone
VTNDRSQASRTETPSALDGAVVARLRSGLDSLLQLTDQLGRVLAVERERLVARDWDAILQLVEDKDSLVQRLQAQSQEFEKCCASAITGSGAASLLAMLDAAGLGAAHATLRMRAAHMQRANRESRALLDHHHARVDTALRLMNRADAPSSSTLGLYGRDGYYARGAASATTASVVQGAGGRIGGTGRRLAEA